MAGVLLAFILRHEIGLLQRLAPPPLVLSSPDARAYSANNSKRVDLLLASRSGDPIGAIEYQGHGHYQGTAAARDAVKKEALRKGWSPVHRGHTRERHRRHGPRDFADSASGKANA
jgi:hypothetical protein